VSLDKVQFLGIILTVILISASIIFISEHVFPAFRYAKTPEKLVPTGEAVGKKSGMFLWEHRFIDITVQAFVLFASAIGCLAVLRAERW